MIKPINTGIQINKISNSNISNQQVSPKIEQQIDLSGYEVGQAMMAQSGIAFRSMPNDVTSKYNAVKDDKTHLNLPNIQVYEYPDTNLKVVVNKGKDLDYSLAGMEIKNPELAKSEPLMFTLLVVILLPKEERKNLDFYDDGDGISYIQALESDEDYNLGKFNKSIFSSNFTEEDFKEAKEVLEDILNEYGRADIIPKLQNISIEDIRKYYNDFLKGCSINANVLLSDVDYENNKNKVLREINKNIPLKLDDNLNKINKSYFVPNDEMTITECEEGFMPLEFHYDIENLSPKDNIIREMTEIILFGKYFITGERHGLRDVLDNLDKKNKIEYYKVHVDLPFGEKIDIAKELEEFNSFLQKVCDSDLEQELEQRKALEKEDIRYHLTEDDDAYTRYSEQVTSDIFNAYEQIDSITQDDIKNYIRKFLINQTPNVYLYAKEKE